MKKWCLIFKEDLKLTNSLLNLPCKNRNSYVGLNAVNLKYLLKRVYGNTYQDTLENAIYGIHTIFSMNLIINLNAKIM
jgi:hypothetical protein